MTTSRREVGTRKIGFFHKLARSLVRLGLTPNQVSVSSAFFAILGACCFVAAAEAESTSRVLLLIGAILGIQFRLICNLIDGLMAVENGLKTASGEIFNDLPDRISDVVLIVGAGVFAQSFHPLMIHVAWLAAVIAVMTAYIRMLGASMTGVQDFSGPMAKQHRMFLLSLGAVGAMVEVAFAAPAYTLTVVLISITLGSAITCVNRLRRLYRRLEGKA